MIRAATPDDAAACAAIYAPYVRESTISFELEPPTTQQMAARMTDAAALHAWLVLEVDGRVAGYAYGHRYGTRPAYRWTCEVSIYLEQGRRRTGGGRALYAQLLETLQQRGYRQALAAVVVPNEPSAALHRALGFEQVGLFENVGFKDGQWLGVAWLRKLLGDQPFDAHPAEPH